MKFIIVLAITLGMHGMAEASRPNFVIVLADDVGWDAFGCTGSKHANTPNIDDLASQSLQIDRCYGTVSQCSPIRAELYTGLYPYNNGVLGNGVSLKRPGVKNMADYLSAVGYDVGLTGKGSGGRGFAKVDGFPGGCNSSMEAYSMDGSKTFIKTALAGEKNFCLMICSIHAHHPWDCGEQANFPVQDINLPPHHIDTPSTRESLSRHAAEVGALDRQVGDTMAMLKEMGLEENTVLIFLSEQGIAMPRAKWTIYDHGCRALCLVRWPGTIQARRSTAIAQYCDILPTLIDFAGGPSPKLDGRSMKKLWLGTSKTHREFAYLSNDRPVYQRAIVYHDYKLVWNPIRDGTYLWQNFTSKSKFFSMAWAEWVEASKSDPKAKAIHDHVIRPPEFELYQIDDDPYETNNLAAKPEYAEKVSAMFDELKKAMTQIGEPTVPEIHYGPKKNR